MRVSGHIEDQRSGRPIVGAIVRLEIGGGDATTRTDGNGDYMWSDDRSYRGQILTCVVEKEGYRRKELTEEIASDELRLDVGLEPVEREDPEPEHEPQRRDLRFPVWIGDEEGRPVEGARVEVTHQGRPLPELRTDTAGRVTVEIRAASAEPVVSYRVEGEGYETATGTLHPRIGVEMGITLTETEPEADGGGEELARPFWFAVGGVVVGFIFYVLVEEGVDIGAWVGAAVILGACIYSGWTRYRSSARRPILSFELDMLGLWVGLMLGGALGESPGAFAVLVVGAGVGVVGAASMWGVDKLFGSGSE